MYTVSDIAKATTTIFDENFQLLQITDPNHHVLYSKMTFSRILVTVEGLLESGEWRFTQIQKWDESKNDFAIDLTPELMSEYETEASLALDFVTEHINKSDLKFRLHNFLVLEEKLKIHHLSSVKVQQNKIFCSYKFSDSGKGSTIISLKKVLNYLNDEALTYCPARDPYYHLSGLKKMYQNRCVLLGYIIKFGDSLEKIEPGKKLEHHCFITARCEDGKGHTRIDQFPDPTEWDDMPLYIRFDRLTHKYSSCMCFYDAIWAHNGSEFESYFSNRTTLEPRGFGDKKKDKKKKN